MGKTQIVLELAYRLRDKYPECSVFWIPATSAESLNQAYLDIGRHFGISELAQTQADMKKLVQHHLSQKNAGQWLLIIDNIDDMELWTNGLKDFLPRSHQGSVVFTTRNRKVAVKLAQSDVIEVPNMEEDVAAQMMQRSLINQELLADHQITRKLLELLTFLPLAIKQAAAYINQNTLTLSDYVALLAEQEENVVELLSEDFEDEGRYQEVKNPIASTWLISFEQMQRLDPLAAEYLSFMSCVNPKGIPKSLLPPAKSLKKKIDAIGTLSAYAFVSQHSTGDALDVHRLVHLAMRNWLKQSESSAIWSVKAITRLCDVLSPYEHESWSIWRLYMSHAHYAIDYGNSTEQSYEMTLWDLKVKLAKSILNQYKVSKIANHDLVLELQRLCHQLQSSTAVYAYLLVKIQISKLDF